MQSIEINGIAVAVAEEGAGQPVVPDTWER